MKKRIWLIISLTLLVIGIHQTYINGFGYSYWIFMFSLAFLFLYSYLKGSGKQSEKSKD